MSHIRLLAIAIIVANTLLASIASGDNKTNINEVTSFFKDNLENREQIESMLEEGKQSAMSGIESKGAFEAVGTKEQDAVNESNRLDSINPNDLETKGAEVRYKEENKYMDSLYINHDDNQVQNHKKDVDLITEKTQELTNKLQAGFLKENMDCETVKGNKEVSPEYHIDVKSRTEQESVYSQTNCEQLRNQYSCRDTLTTRCIRTGTRYKAPEPRKIRFNGHWLHHNKMNWGWAVKWKTKRWGWHITSHHPGGWEGGEDYQIDSPWRQNPAAIIADARAHIASHLGLPLEQIGEHVDFPGRGMGNINPVGARWRVAWDEYEFGYTYKEPYQVCEEWMDDWNERCNIK